MAGHIRLFEKAGDGLLVEVHPDKAADARAERRCSRVAVEVDILWTPEEEIALSDEEAEANRLREIQAKADLELAAHRQAVLDRFAKLGFTKEDLDIL